MPLNDKLWAAEELLKRYALVKKTCLSTDMRIECLATIISVNTNAYQKKAARILLNFDLGVKETNNLIEEHAIVTDRGDTLVSRWRKKVVERDGACVQCGEKNNLHAHHISHWADDPINRINLDNGATLCSECHAKEHPEIKKLILSRSGN